MTDYKECDRCGQDKHPDGFQTIELLDEWELCGGCVGRLNDEIEFHDWRERYTEEQHQRAMDLLSDQDEIECVLGSYDDGQIVVHTPYVSSDAVADVCEHFGLRLASFYPIWAQESEWPCMPRHGSMFEIVLQYDTRCRAPIPMKAEFYESHIDSLDENDRQFDT